MRWERPERLAGGRGRGCGVSLPLGLAAVVCLATTSGGFVSLENLDQTIKADRSVLKNVGLGTTSQENKLDNSAAGVGKTGLDPNEPGFQVSINQLLPVPAEFGQAVHIVAKSHPDRGQRGKLVGMNRATSAGQDKGVIELLGNRYLTVSTSGYVLTFDGEI